MYNRGVQFQKLAYKATTRKLFDGIVLTKEEDGWIQANLKKPDFDVFRENVISQKMYNDFLDYREKTKDGGPLQKF